jgi:hypothetical protein
MDLIILLFFPGRGARGSAGVGSRAYVNAAAQHQEPLTIFFWKFFRKDSLMLRRTSASRHGM